MSGYKIHYLYTDGNTFGSESNLPGELDYVFASLDDAKTALQRMREHYYWQVGEASAYREDHTGQPSWWKPQPSIDKWALKWYFNTPGNDGKEVWLAAGSYLGYFAHLESAEIRAAVESDDDMRFTV